MDYNKIDNNLEYNDTEKKYIGQIMNLLQKIQIPQEQKLEFEGKLVQIFSDFNKLDKSDEYYIGKRQEINQRIYVLFTHLYETEKRTDTYKVETDITEFRSIASNLINSLNDIDKSLRLSLDVNSNITMGIEKIDLQYKELFEQFQIIQNKIDKFKEKYSDSDFSLSIVELRKEIALLQKRIRDVKLMQIEQYNVSVLAVNKKITELKSMKNLSEDMLIRIDNLKELAIFETGKGFSYRNKNYLKKLNYEKLLETMTNVNNIKISEKEKETHVYEDLMYASILNDIDKIENELNRELSRDDVKLLKDEIASTYKKLYNFNIRIKNNLSAYEQKAYLEKITNCQLQLDELNRKYVDIVYKNTQSDYKMLGEQINEVKENILYYSTIIESLRGEIKQVVSLDIQEKLDKLSLKLDDIEKKIEEKYRDGKLDDIQYKNLSDNLTINRESISDVSNKLKNPIMLKDVNVFDNLSGQIDHFDKMMISLNKDLDNYTDIIKDKEKRKNIDKVIDTLWNDDSNIRKYLELHKNEDKDKYAELMKKLEVEEKNLDEFSKKYREKCPFMVKNVKSAKSLYKKHPKMSLVLGGVAALALVSVTLGPVIIPTIMRHNMIIGYRIPALRKMTVDVNKVLGASIGAKVVNHTWVLSNGLPLSVSVASASMLKAIALVGARSAALATVLILGAKKVINKMNLSNLKDKLLDIYYSSADIDEIEANEYNSSRKR